MTENKTKKNGIFHKHSKIVYTSIRFRKNLIFIPLTLAAKVNDILTKTLLPYFLSINKVKT